MRTLHILRKEPGPAVVKLIDIMSNEDVCAVTSLYQEDVDWFRLVEDIFAYDRIICW